MSLLLDLLYPINCLGCGHSGQYLCPACFSALTPNALTPPSPDSTLDGHLCLFPYRPPFSDLVHLLKYQYTTHLVDQIVPLIATSFKSNFPHLLTYWHSHHFIITPIPLHPLRLNWRGFNQSALVLKKLAPLIDLPYYPDLLLRTRYTTPQARQENKSQRLKNLSSAFQINSKYSQSVPQNIILFDDVYTTGSTLESAATVLKSAGTISVPALTLSG